MELAELISMVTRISAGFRENAKRRETAIKILLSEFMILAQKTPEELEELANKVYTIFERFHVNINNLTKHGIYWLLSLAREVNSQSTPAASDMLMHLARKSCNECTCQFLYLMALDALSSSTKEKLDDRLQHMWSTYANRKLAPRFRSKLESEKSKEFRKKFVLVLDDVLEEYVHAKTNVRSLTMLCQKVLMVKDHSDRVDFNAFTVLIRVIKAVERGNTDFTGALAEAFVAEYYGRQKRQADGASGSPPKKRRLGTD